MLNGVCGVWGVEGVSGVGGGRRRANGMDWLGKNVSDPRFCNQYTAAAINILLLERE